MKRLLHGIYRRLLAHFGPQAWWPAETDFEIVVGAILTQNTAWTNVEKAIANLRRAHLLNPSAMHRVSTARLARLIRPSGYFNLKAKRLHAFTHFLFIQHHGKLSHLFKRDISALREELLSVYGIGPETADSIILYAARQPVFVVDAYTQRVFARLGLASENATYEELQDVLMTHLPHDERMFNEYHALIVALGKNLCRKRAPTCGECPLRKGCSTWQTKIGRGQAMPWAKSKGQSKADKILDQLAHTCPGGDASARVGQWVHRLIFPIQFVISTLYRYNTPRYFPSIRSLSWSSESINLSARNARARMVSSNA